MNAKTIAAFSTALKKKRNSAATAAKAKRTTMTRPVKKELRGRTQTKSLKVRSN